MEVKESDIDKLMTGLDLEFVDATDGINGMLDKWREIHARNRT